MSHSHREDSEMREVEESKPRSEVLSGTGRGLEFEDHGHAWDRIPHWIFRMNILGEQT